MFLYKISYSLKNCLMKNELFFFTPTHYQKWQGVFIGGVRLFFVSLKLVKERSDRHLTTALFRLFYLNGYPSSPYFGIHGESPIDFLIEKSAVNISAHHLSVEATGKWKLGYSFEELCFWRFKLLVHPRFGVTIFKKEEKSRTNCISEFSPQKVGKPSTVSRNRTTISWNLGSASIYKTASLPHVHSAISRASVYTRASGDFGLLCSPLHLRYVKHCT